METQPSITRKDSKMTAIITETDWTVEVRLVDDSRNEVGTLYFDRVTQATEFIENQQVENIEFETIG